MIAYEPLVPQSGSTRVEFGYDYMSRRSEKRVYTHNGTSWATTPSEHKRFVWSGWLMLLELDETAGTPPTIAVRRKQTWGLDLAGQHGGSNSLESAGGIGGLLSLYDTVGTGSTGDDRSFALFCDANGNVGQLLELTAGTNYGSVAAAYEYDAYGNRINALASGEYEQPWRFSTKQFDAETGLSYYGYRYYSSALGRFLARDMISDHAFASGARWARRFRVRADRSGLFRFAGNAPAGAVDLLGLTTIFVSGIDPSGPINGLEWCERTDYIGRSNRNYEIAPVFCGMSGNPCGSHATGLRALPDVKTSLECDAKRNAPCVEDALRGDCKCVVPRRIGIIMIAPKTTHAPNIDCKCCRLSFLILFDHEDIVPNGSLNPFDPGNTLLGNGFWKDNFTSGKCVSGTARDVDFGGLTSHGGEVATGECGTVHLHGGLWSGFNEQVDICEETRKFAQGKDDVIVCHSQGCNITMHAINSLCQKPKKDK